MILATSRVTAAVLLILLPFAVALTAFVTSSYKALGPDTPESPASAWRMLLAFVVGAVCAVVFGASSWFLGLWILFVVLR